MALGISICRPPSRHPSPLAQQFIDFMLQPDTQVVFAKGSGAGPVHRKTQLPPELQKGLPYGERSASC